MRQEFYPLLPWKTTSEIGKSNGKKEGVKDKALGLDAIHGIRDRLTIKKSKKYGFSRHIIAPMKT